MIMSFHFNFNRLLEKNLIISNIIPKIARKENKVYYSKFLTNYFFYGLIHIL